MANLATLDQFKTYKSINTTNTKEDASLNQLLTAASEFIKTYCDRSFIDNVDEEKVEYFDGSTKAIYYLSEYPLIDSIVELSEDGGKTYTVINEYDSYFKGEDYITFGNGYFNPIVSHHAIKVTYTAGYEDIPLDLTQATLDLVEYYRKTEYNPKSSLGSNMVERSTADYYGSNLPGHIYRVLSNYRSI